METNDKVNHDGKKGRNPMAKAQRRSSLASIRLKAHVKDLLEKIARENYRTLSAEVEMRITKSLIKEGQLTPAGEIPLPPSGDKEGKIHKKEED